MVGENCDLPLVENSDHLVQEKIVMDFAHLANDRHKLTIPAVCLFAYRRIEEPVVPIDEFRERGWIAVHSAELIAVLVFDSCMEDVDRETYVVQPGLPRCDDVLEEDARAVKETERGLCTWHVRGEGGKNKFLPYTIISSHARVCDAGEWVNALVNLTWTQPQRRLHVRR